MEVFVNPHTRSPAPRARRNLVRNPILSLAMAAALASAAPAVAATIATGTFQSKESGITASGDFEIQETAGKFKLVIKSDFQVSEGPDLFFTFNPLPAAQVTGANAKTYALKIDPQLAALKGAQSFDLPADFAVEKYQSLLIHCWKYNHLYAAAAVKKEASMALGEGSRRPAQAAGVGGPRGNGFRLGREDGRLWTVQDKAGSRRFDFTGRSEALPIR
jgi:hypothetical protein